MEPLGAMSEGEWNSFSGMYYADEADFMAQLLGNCSFPNELPRSSSFDTPSTLWHGHESAVHMSEFEEGVMDSSDNTSTDMHSFSLGDGYGGGGSVFFSTSSHGSYLPSDFHQILLTNNSSMSMNFLNQDMHCGKMDESTGSLPETVQFGNNLQLKRESEILIPEPPSKDKNHHPLEKSKKRSWVSGEVQNKSNMRSKKNQKLVLISNNDGDNNARPKRQNSSSYGSEDESNASQEFIGGMTPSLSPKSASALNLNGKSRASRGSATDPQSLYARKRRERINERLRILQSLVPNGTKVDISTMLEEAVQYVKFLQLQIKLLSSDDLWMYSPIAYNGMDIGLDLKITTPR